MCLTCSLFLLFLKRLQRHFGASPRPLDQSVPVWSQGYWCLLSLALLCFCKDQVSTVLKSLPVPCSSAVLTSGPLGFNHWLLPMNAIEKVPGNPQPPKYLTLVPSTDRNSIFFGTRNHHIWNIILASRCVSYITFLILASYFHYTDENTESRGDTWVAWNQ